MPLSLLSSSQHDIVRKKSGTPTEDHICMPAEARSFLFASRENRRAVLSYPFAMGMKGLYGK